VERLVMTTGAEQECNWMTSKQEQRSWKMGAFVFCGGKGRRETQNGQMSRLLSGDKMWDMGSCLIFQDVTKE